MKYSLRVTFAEMGHKTRFNKPLYALSINPGLKPGFNRFVIWLGSCSRTGVHAPGLFLVIAPLVGNRFRLNVPEILLRLDQQTLENTILQ